MDADGVIFETDPPLPVSGGQTSYGRVCDAIRAAIIAGRHLPGARLVPFGIWQYLFGPTLPAGLPRDKPIVVYCTIGWRSGKTAEALRAKGYDRVVNLEGGIIQWHNEGGAVVDASNQATRQVHPYAERYARFIRE